jgi:hypothetical protein
VEAPVSFLYELKKYKFTVRDFREENISIKSLDSISVLWRPRGDSPDHCPLNAALGSISYSGLCCVTVNEI